MVSKPLQVIFIRLVSLKLVSNQLKLFVIGAVDMYHKIWGYGRVS